MSEQELKKALAELACRPDPARKRAFFRSMPARPVSHLRMIWDQAGHVNPITWLASAAVFAGALAVGRLIPGDGLWIASALTPFAALAAVTESGRSALWGMEELELASRFGLKSTVLARLGAVGLAHALLLAALAAMLGTGSGSVLRTGVYLLTPYLITDLLGLAAARRIRGREGLYVCGGAAVLTAGLAAALHSVRGVYAPGNFRWWLLALAAAAVLAGREYTKTIRKTEELSWN